MSKKSTELLTMIYSLFGGIDPLLYKWEDIHGTRFDHIWGDGEGVGWLATDGA